MTASSIQVAPISVATRYKTLHFYGPQCEIKLTQRRNSHHLSLLLWSSSTSSLRLYHSSPAWHSGSCVQHSTRNQRTLSSRLRKANAGGIWFPEAVKIKRIVIATFASLSRFWELTIGTGNVLSSILKSRCLSVNVLDSLHAVAVGVLSQKLWTVSATSNLESLASNASVRHARWKSLRRHSKRMGSSHSYAGTVQNRRSFKDH